MVMRVSNPIPTFCTPYVDGGSFGTMVMTVVTVCESQSEGKTGNRRRGNE